METATVQTRRSSKGSSGKRSLQSLLKSAAYRIIAPYTIFGVEEPIAENKVFDQYLKEKPKLLLSDWTNYLNNSQDLFQLLQQSARMLKKVNKATGVNLYIVDADEIYYAGRGNTCEWNKIRWKIREDSNVAAYVAYNLNYVMVNQVLRDSRFPKGVAYYPLAGSVICCPILTSATECYAVVEIYRNLTEPSFTVDDLEFTVMVTSWMGVAVQRNFERLKLEKQRVLNDYLLNLTRCFYADPSLLKQTISDTVNFARVTLNAQRGCFLILEKKLFCGYMTARAYDAHDSTGIEPVDPGHVVVLNRKGTIDHVLRTREFLNIADVTKDSRFNRDLLPGYLTRSVLCMPIENQGKILGVIQIKNKRNGKCFNSIDELLFRTFSVYCSLGAYYNQCYRKMKNAKYYTVSFEKLLNYVSPCLHLLKQLHDNPFEPLPKNFYSFSWDTYTEEQMQKRPKYLLYMITKLLGRYSVYLEGLINFVLLVQNCYADLPFHNFSHAFRFTHILFIILSRNAEKFSSVEKKGLLIGGLCHEIDHPGFTNMFLELSKSGLTVLYEDSYQENHHYFVTRRLMLTTGVFRYITKEEFELICQEIKKAILFTDIYYFQRMKPTISKHIVTNFSWNNSVHRSDVKHLIMTAAEWAAVWKSYHALTQAFNNYFTEKFHEGDLLKQLGYTPIFGFDRKRVGRLIILNLRAMKLNLIPGLKLLKYVLPNTRDFYEHAQLMVRNWEMMANREKIKLWNVIGAELV